MSEHQQSTEVSKANSPIKNKVGSIFVPVRYREVPQLVLPGFGVE